MPQNSQPYVVLSGSERASFTDVLEGAKDRGPADPNDEISVSVYLRPASASRLASEANRPGRTPLSSEEAIQLLRAEDANYITVRAFAKGHKLRVVSEDSARNLLVLSGTVAAMSEAFRVHLRHYEHSGRHYRGRTGALQVPADLATIVDGVIGLDNRPQVRMHLQRRVQAAGEPHGYDTPAVATCYQFPTVNADGQCIGIIELQALDGGGYRHEDLDTYFQSLHRPVPTITDVSVNGGENNPTGDPNDENSADGEIALDIEVASAVAPGARLAVYFAPDASDRSFIDAVTQAITDTTNQPSVISISWGGPESEWSAQAIRVMDHAFQQAATLGVTVCVAAGDHGSSDYPPGKAPDQLAHVDFPASDPYVLGCGGTQLTMTKGAYGQETVWNDRNGWATGGGVSDKFPLPAWQEQANVPSSANRNGRTGRGVPDVSGNADILTGYDVTFDGVTEPIGGTSAVAPLWAGLIALINAQLGSRVGYLNPTLYERSSGSNAFHDISTGDNKIVGVPGYEAGSGWDPCTGLGSPNGAALVQMLQTALNTSR
jgi:kumamolisin